MIGAGERLCSSFFAREIEDGLFLILHFRQSRRRWRWWIIIPEMIFSAIYFASAVSSIESVRRGREKEGVEKLSGKRQMILQNFSSWFRREKEVPTLFVSLFLFLSFLLSLPLSNLKIEPPSNSSRTGFPRLDPCYCHPVIYLLFPLLLLLYSPFIFRKMTFL